MSMYVDRLPPLICPALSCHFLEKDETHSEGKHLELHSSNVVQEFLNCCPSLSDELWQDAARKRGSNGSLGSAALHQSRRNLFP